MITLIIIKMVKKKEKNKNLINIFNNKEKINDNYKIIFIF